MELLKQNHLLKIDFVIFLKGAPFSDFVDYKLLNYMPTGIQICIPLFWGIFFQLGSSLIKQWTHQWIQSSSYVFTEIIFVDLLLILNQIFLKHLTKICSPESKTAILCVLASYFLWVEF